MNDFIWHIDDALIIMSKGPLAVLSIVLGMLLGITAALVIYSQWGSR